MFAERGCRVFLCGDETGVRMEELPGLTMEVAGAKDVQVQTTGGEKTMFTVFLASRMVVDEAGKILKVCSVLDGENSRAIACCQVSKEPPLIIFKGAEKGRITAEIQKAKAESDHACAVATTQNGWQTGDLFLQWVKQTVKFSKKVLLVVDLYAAHRDNDVLDWMRKSGNDIVFIPGGCTSMLQV